MNRIRRLAGSVLASAFAVLVVSALLPARAGAAGESLSLDPREGPPNTSVTWVAEGFADCQPVDDVVPDGIVALRWDGTQELGRAKVSAEDGTASSIFLVPESAKLDVHRVTATCQGDGGMTAGAEFSVTPPQVVQVPVPNVIGMSEGRARTILEDEKFPMEVIGKGDAVQRQDPPGGTPADPGSVVVVELGNAQQDTVAVPFLIGLGLEVARAKIQDAGLVLGGVSGDQAGQVTDQSPGAGAEVLKGATVSISLAADTTTFVVVPDLVGEALEGVPGILVAQGLTLGVVTGNLDPDKANVVVSQQPPAGSEVASNSEVNVSVEPDVDAVQFVEVPDVVGVEAATARSRLEDLRLLPVGSEDSDGEVTDQQPPAGTLVPLGSPVSLVVESQTPGAGLVVGLVVLVAAAVAARGPLSRSLDRRWVRTHLDIRPGGRPREASVSDVEAAGSAPTRVVRVVPRYDPETHVLQEEER